MSVDLVRNVDLPKHKTEAGSLDLDVAYGDNSLVKVRLHPKDLGELLYKCSPEQLEEALSSMLSYRVYMPVRAIKAQDCVLSTILRKSLMGGRKKK